MSAAATRLLAKLAAFIESCDEEERALLAMLLAPGLGEVYDGEDDVRGFVMSSEPGEEPRSLASALGLALERRIEQAGG